MNEVQRCRVERIIRKVLKENKDKPLNEIKRMVKDAIRIKNGSKREIEENMKLITEINSEMIERVMAENKSSGKQNPTEYVVDAGINR